ncbi:MAG: cyclic nucleotide-binding domain-containing protein [Deltaproteobacteria bacterium]|nr:cyclic nucleotide-binding domain-containing protein [Deltaproteobacteria bacterium]
MESKQLKNIRIFNKLNDVELAQVNGMTREKRFHKGEIIMQEGQAGDTMYLIVSGDVEVTKTLTMKFGQNDFRETEKVMTRFGPDDHEVFGEMALIARENRSASITAITDCVLLEINREDFLMLVENSPGLGARILMGISELLVYRLRKVSQDVIRLTTALSVALSK